MRETYIEPEIEPEAHLVRPQTEEGHLAIESSDFEKKAGAAFDWITENMKIRKEGNDGYQTNLMFTEFYEKNPEAANFIAELDDYESSNELRDNIERWTQGKYIDNNVLGDLRKRYIEGAKNNRYALPRKFITIH